MSKHAAIIKATQEATKEIIAYAMNSDPSIQSRILSTLQGIVDLLRQEEE